MTLYDRTYFADAYAERQAAIMGEIDRLIAENGGPRSMSDEQWRAHLQARVRLAEIEARKESA